VHLTADTPEHSAADDLAAAAAPAGAAAPAMGALARLKQCLPELRGTSSRVGAFVLANPWEVRGLPINDLADRVGVSVNSVRRLTRTLGYRGYREFAQALTLDLGKVLGSAYSLPSAVADAAPEGGDDAAIVIKTLALEMVGLQDTIRDLDLALIRRTVDVLSRAHAMLFVGTGSGLSVCSLAAYRITMLGLRATYSGDPNAILAELHLLSPGDVLFAVSYHGATPHLVRALRHARERGVATVCVTAAPGSPAARAADICIVTFGPAMHAGAEQFVSRVLTTAVVEALIAGVVWKRFGGTPPHLDELLRRQREFATATGDGDGRPTASSPRRTAGSKIRLSGE
jgi:DNA-binding MurR/RpiR family transcriptional regulator